MCSDKKCQADKNCQSNVMRSKKPRRHMWSVTKKTDVQLPKPAVLHQYRRVCKDKNCQAKICEYDDFKGQSSMCSDKNCQENEIINIQSVTNTNNMWLPKPSIRRLCSDNKCQSTRCYKKKSPVRPMYAYDKNCQSANMM